MRKFYVLGYSQIKIYYRSNDKIAIHFVFYVYIKFTKYFLKERSTTLNHALQIKKCISAKVTKSSYTGTLFIRSS